MRSLLLPLVAASLAGCAAAPVGEVPTRLFADAHFRPPAQPVRTDDLFTLDEAMQAFANDVLTPYMERQGVHAGVFQGLRRHLTLDNDAPGTRPAATTFEARTGNCLSLVILTSAFAKRFGIPAHYQAVQGLDTWSRAGGIAFYSGHVNVRLGQREGAVADARSIAGLTVDYIGESNRFASHPVSEHTLVAMYANNRAAEALLAGDLDAAYAWVRAAVAEDPAYLASVNTLGVIYLRRGLLGKAESAFEHVLRLEPANANAMMNLALALGRDGRRQEAETWRRRLAALSSYPPFYFLDEGLAALERGEAAQARDLLQRELARMPYNEEVHFAIARADVRLGDVELARKHLVLAQRYSTARTRRDVYSAKLATLRDAPR
jgi:Tfp pilus assembly protein PilF